MATKGKSPLKIIIRIVILVVLVLSTAGGWWFWKLYFRPNTHVISGESGFLFVTTGMTMEQLTDLLMHKGLIDDRSSFEWTCKLKKFDTPKPGRYRIREGMSNREVVNLLKAGLQEPVRFTFNGVRTKEQLAGRVGGKLEADSTEILDLLEDDDFLNQYGLNEETAMTLFRPATYEFYWNTTAQQFFDKMAEEYKEFWTAERKKKASEIGLTQSQVITLASIVEAEQTRFADERPAIAGLYMNRLREGMPLQSDPTVIYAMGDFSINRVLKGDLDYDSPYNTYMNKGLPPGPILLPEASSIDAVLNYKRSNYIYMCAEFGTGRHRFTSSYDVHLKNAREYQNALNKADIKR